MIKVEETIAPIEEDAAPAHAGLRSHTRKQIVLLAILAMAALVSLCMGVREAFHGGIDFQWSGASLLSEHVDPWKTFIGGDPQHRIILSQEPNYLHELYVLFLPFGKTSFEDARAIWCGANLLFLVTSIVLTARIYKLQLYNALLLGCLLLISAPLRVTFLNGQQCLFILCCFSIAFSATSRIRRGFFLGLGFAKYSFAPIIAMVDLLRLRLISLCCAAIPILAGLLIVWRITGTDLPHLIFEPIRSAKISVAPGYGDIITALRIGLRHFNLTQDQIFSIASGIGFLCAIIFAVFLAKKRLSEKSELSLITVITLACFTHVAYDYIFLLFPMAALLEFSQIPLTALTRDSPGRVKRVMTVAWISILYLLIVGTIKKHLHPAEWLPFIVSNLIALLLIAYALLALEKAKSRSAIPL
jgi:Glycosyltransferase family 87